jgi:hypothetical protein
MRPRPASVTCALLTISIALLGCGNSRSLQSVSINPATATSQAQFTATGTYNASPTSVDITGSTTWCIGSSNGICDGNVVQGASVSNGLAQCLSGFSGTVTVLAGKPGAMSNPDQGFQLKPFGAAQLICP